MHNNISRLVTVAAFFAVFAGYSFMSATSWTAPTGMPPTNNVDEPINTGSDLQIKEGKFGASAVSATTIIGTGQVRTNQFCTADGSKCATLEELLADKDNEINENTQSGESDGLRTSMGDGDGVDHNTRYYLTARVTFKVPFTETPTVVISNKKSDCPFNVDSVSVSRTGFSARTPTYTGYGYDAGRCTGSGITWIATGSME